jgi:hypothetical protein
MSALGRRRRRAGIFEIAAPYDAGTLLPSAWSFLQGSPGEGAILIDDGVNLFASTAEDTSGQSYYSAPVGAGTPWQRMAPAGGARGAYSFADDVGHHVVYSSNLAGGLWRLTSR